MFSTEYYVIIIGKNTIINKILQSFESA